MVWHGLAWSDLTWHGIAWLGRTAWLRLTCIGKAWLGLVHLVLDGLAASGSGVGSQECTKIRFMLCRPLIPHFLRILWEKLLKPNWSV